MNNIEESIKIVKNPMSWFRYFQQQKFIGDTLLEKATCSEELLKIREDLESSNMITLMINAHYHWGIAIENGLKGIYVNKFSEQIIIHVIDGGIQIKNIGGQAGKTHNLLKLAEHLEIFNHENNIYNNPTDYESLKQVLSHLSDVIKWTARYPISHNTSNIFRPSRKRPLQLIYGFHILDIINPLFDFFERQVSEKKG